MVGRLPEAYARAIAADSQIHFIDEYPSPYESPILSECEDHPPAEARLFQDLHPTQWMETDSILAWGFHECWEMPGRRLNTIRVEFIPKIVFRHPELLVATRGFPSLGASLVDLFSGIAQDIPTDHPRFGFHPGTVPLSPLSLLIGGIENLKIHEACDYVKRVFSHKGGGAAFLEAVDQACMARGIVSYTTDFLVHGRDEP